MQVFCRTAAGCSWVVGLEQVNEAAIVNYIMKPAGSDSKSSGRIQPVQGRR